MKQLVVLSGKGGSGKTSLTAAFADLATQGSNSISTVLADADVDAANLELVTQPNSKTTEQFWGGNLAEIDANTCSNCGECELVCRFEAISQIDTAYVIDPLACEGCAACYYQCPEGSISMHPQIAGDWYQSHTRFGPLFHAYLFPGQENSGKLVTVVKHNARLCAIDQNADLLLVDGPPGIGCPMISAVSGADMALIVTEPSVSGVHDMRRALQTTKHFDIPAMVCINKADLSSILRNEIENDCREYGIEMIGKIPYDPVIIEAMLYGQPVTSYQPESSVSQAIRVIWECIQSQLLGPCDEVL